MPELTKRQKRIRLKKAGWTNAANSMGEFWTNPASPGVGLPLSMAWLHYNLMKKDQELKEAVKNKTAKVICNKCGADMAALEGDTHMGYYGLVNAKVSGGYCSTALSDAFIYRFSLCEKCLKAIFDSCTIPVEYEPYM